MPGTIIKRLREKKGMKQEAVAIEMGISQAAYSKIENNLTELTVRHCKLLSRIFGENVYEYFDEDFEIRRFRHKPEELVLNGAHKPELLQLK
jgi:transcriptional regulator with XRE-family HTH domain